MLEEEIEFALPSKARITAMPPVAENKNGPLSWRVEWSKGSAGKLTTRLEATLNGRELLLPETIKLQRELGSLLGALSMEINLKVER